jgi:hypothetical protein
MGWQSTAVRPALASTGLALGWALGLGQAGRLDLLGFLERELELLLRQAFGPASEAMTLQLSDDLAQPFAFGPLRQEHGLHQEGCSRTMSQTDRNISANNATVLTGRNALFHSARRRRDNGPPRLVNPPPIEPSSSA